MADAFAEEEITGRFTKQPDYWATYRERLEAVDKQAIQRVARTYLDPARVAILVVGQKDEILKGHPDHPVKWVDLGAGKITDVPLRDPMTMKPITGGTP